jgi:phage terminase small subunit
MTPRQARFVEEYLVDLNATQAAIRAGYSPKTANEQGARLLAKASVQEAVQAAQRARSEATGVTAARVVEELARIAFVDVGDLFDESERMKPLNEMPEAVRRAIAGVEIAREKRVTKVDADNVETDITDDVRKVKLWDKPRALELLARHLGMLKDTVRHEGIPQLVVRVTDDI